jgi:flagellar hook-associated protein FlgK
MTDFTIGLSALTASQRALDIIGENIANSGTPGYHRQELQLVEATPTLFGNLYLGNGVDVARIRRLQDNALEQAVTQNTYQSNSTNAQLNILQQVQTQFTSNSGSIDTLLSNFFNQLSQLAAQPDNMTQRQVFLGNAVDLTNEFNSVAGNLDQLGGNIDSQIQQLVGQVNQISPQIAALNQQIQLAEIQGTSPNDLLDQRDQLINQLAQIVDVQTVQQPFGVKTVLAGGMPLAIGGQSTQLVATTDSSGNDIVTAAGSKAAMNIAGGQLAGLLTARNQALPNYRSGLDTLARALIQQLDDLHATGIGLNGPMTSLSGSRAVTSVTAPLSQAGLAFPPQAGTLSISVTNLATGQRTLSQLAIDPSTESLQGLASAISGISHLQAVVDPQSGTLKILAQPGYGFDFAGRVSTTPDTSFITGTTTVQVGGAYTGTNNDDLTYKFTGSGTVGVTPGLTLQVQDSAGNTVASLNVGQGYQPGSALQVGNGVTVALSAGTANAGDSFTTQVVANADTGGILTSLGLNTLFTGESANNIAIQPTILADATQLAASRSGAPADGTNLQRMAAVQDQQVLANGTQTVGQFYGAMVGDVGRQVQQLTQQQSAQQLTGQQIQAQQQSVSGVDPNQELVNMLQSQRSYQLAAQYISTVNNTLNDLYQLVGNSLASSTG